MVDESVQVPCLFQNAIDSEKEGIRDESSPSHDERRSGNESDVIVADIIRTNDESNVNGPPQKQGSTSSTTSGERNIVSPTSLESPQPSATSNDDGTRNDDDSPSSTIEQSMMRKSGDNANEPTYQMIFQCATRAAESYLSDMALNPTPVGSQRNLPNPIQAAFATEVAGIKPRKWTPDEIDRLNAAIRIHGRQDTAILAQAVGTRNVTQIRDLFSNVSKGKSSYTIEGIDPVPSVPKVTPNLMAMPTATSYTTLSHSNVTSMDGTFPQQRVGKWGNDEIERLKEGIRVYGRENVAELKKVVGTRNAKQIRRFFRSNSGSDSILQKPTESAYSYQGHPYAPPHLQPPHYQQPFATNKPNQNGGSLPHIPYPSFPMSHLVPPPSSSSANLMPNVNVTHSDSNTASGKENSDQNRNGLLEPQSKAKPLHENPKVHSSFLLDQIAKSGLLLQEKQQLSTAVGIPLLNESQGVSGQPTDDTETKKRPLASNSDCNGSTRRRRHVATECVLPFQEV